MQYLTYVAIPTFQHHSNIINNYHYTYSASLFHQKNSSLAKLIKNNSNILWIVVYSVLVKNVPQSQPLP